MEAKLTRVSRLDQLDSEAFRDMIESASFKHLLARVGQILERERTTAERSDDVLAIRRAQGAAGALRSVLALPNQLLAEMKPGALRKSV